MKRFLVIVLAFGIACGEAENEIFSCEELTITLSELEYTDCGGSNGTLRVFAKGGREPYAYKINDGPYQSENLFIDLESQYYTIHVEDANGCQDSVRTFLGSVEAVKAVALTQPSGCGEKNGSIKVIAKNGQLPYRYQLGEIADYTFDDTFTGLGPGIYSVWVKDDRDCFLGIYPAVLTGVAIEDVKSIVESSCTLSGCHDSTVAPDLTTDENLIKYSEEIVEVIGDEHQGYQLEAEEIELIGCWALDIELDNR